MILPNKLRMIFKVISATMAGIFLFQQIAWAADIMEMIDPTATNTSSVSPAELIQSQSDIESIIEIANDVEKSAVPVSLPVTVHNVEYDRFETNPNGWTYYYLNNVVQERTYSDTQAYVYEYNTDGRVSELDHYKAGDILYYTADYHYDASGIYTGRTITYPSDGRIDERDANENLIQRTRADGVVLYYDAASGLLTKRVVASGYYYLYKEYYPNNKVKILEYYTSSGALYYTADYHYDASGIYTGRTITYPSDGRIDERDANEKLIQRTYIDGRIELYDENDVNLYAFTINYLANGYGLGNNALGQYVSFKKVNDVDVFQTLANSDGTFTYWTFNVDGSVSGFVKTLGDGSIEVYNSKSILIEKRIPDSSFMRGVNLPWINYGYDMGGGVSSNLATLYSQFDKWRGSVVRIFLFCDLRSGINFDVSGNPISFKQGVFDDMNALLAAAKTFGIKLIPVLFDYMIADGKSGSFIGEHADLITDASKKQALLGLFGTFFDTYAGDSSIYAWDVMNEPEFAGAVAISDTQSFISDFTKLIHSKSTQAKVTVGSARRDWMLQYWTDIGLDIYQFHYYDNFESSLPLDYSVDSLGLDKPVIAGELQPTQALSKLDIVKTNGCMAGLFWQDSSYIINSTDYAAIRNYFSGAKATYTYHTSGRIMAETWTNGTIREFEDLAVYMDGTGRLINETFSDNSYIVYRYYDNEAILQEVITFSSSGNRVMKKNYDPTGVVITITTYYDDGNIRKISNSDGTYQSLDQAGATLEQAVKIGDVISVRYSQNELLREIFNDGTIKECSCDSELLRVLKPDGTSVEYYYDAGGAILNRYEYALDGSFTILDGQNNEVFAYIYDSTDSETPQGDSSALSLTTALGDVMTYENDKIVSIKRKMDGSLITAIELDANGDLKNAYVLHTDGSIDIIYNNSVVETIFPDGTISRYRDGRKAFDYSEAIGCTLYYYTEDASHNILSVTTVNKNATCAYDANGLPIRFEKIDGSVTEYDNGYLKCIIDSTGRQYLYTITTGPSAESTLTTAATGNSVPAKVFYDASKNITSAILPDGTSLSSTNGILQGVTGLDSRISVENGGAFSFDDGDYKTYYDEKGDLKKITTSDNTDIYFEDGQISEVLSEDGTRVLYAGGHITELYDKKEGATYESDSQGRITKVTYDNSGAVFTYHYDDPLPDGSAKVTITKEDDPSNVTVRTYDIDGLLIGQDMPSGIISNYTYEASGESRILTITQTKNGVTIGSYSYQYLAGKTLVTDIKQNIKEYDTYGSIKFMYTPEGYVYEYRMTENSTLVSELTRWDKGAGVTIYYKNGDVERVETIADGKLTVLKEPVFDSEGKLKSFTVILPTGESRRVTVYDDGWSEVNTSDAKLIYKDDPTTGNGHLVAVNSNHRLFMFDDAVKIPSYISVDITNDHDALDFIDLVDGEMTDYTRQKLLAEYGVIENESVPFALVPGNRGWQPQTDNTSTLGITSISTGSDMVIMQAAINNTAGHNQGEAFLDLTIDNNGHTIASPYDLNNKTVSFYVKLQDGTLPAGSSLVVQAFAKDSSWKSEYSMQVTITEAGTWFKVELDISAITPMFGLKDAAFDPSRIRLVGIRVVSTSANPDYNGQIYLKDANYQSAPAGEKVVDFPFLVNKNSIQPYVGTIPGDQVAGNPNYISWTDIPTLFLPASTTGNNGQINLDTGTWRAQTYLYSAGVEAVTRDDVNNQWVLGLDLIAGDQSKNDGEMYVDLSYDIPGYTWSGPLDLAGKTLTFKVKAPAGFLAASNSANNPMWAQVFVKDEKYNYQYGKYVQITQEGQWITVTLIPQVGEIEEGNSKTSPDFDPTRIINIGVKISCNEDSVSAYQGDFYVQNATPVDVLNRTAGVYLLDINALKDYAATKNLNLTFEESLGPQIRFAKQSLPTYFKDSSFNMATEYYLDSSIKSVLKGNSRVEYYRTDGKLLKITDKDDRTLVQYTYDMNGDVVEIDYSGTRDGIRKSMEDARIQSRIAADKSILDIYESKNEAIVYIDSVVKPGLDSAYRTLADLDRLWHEWDNKKTGWFGDTSRAEKKANMRSIEQSIGQVQNAIQSLLAEAARQYALVNTSIDNAINGTPEQEGIYQILEDNLNDIDIVEEDALIRSLEQEVIEVVGIYFGQTLGRSPSEAEFDYWLTRARSDGCINPDNRIPFNGSLVKMELTTTQVYIDEALENDKFIKDVIDAISAYLNITLQGVGDKRAKIIADFGLLDSEISYEEKDFDAILKWLSSNNKHFGRSAFLTLKELLTNNGKTVDLVDLAVNTALIDIFTSSITSITTGPLEISLFALSKYAKIKHNLDLYNVQLNTQSLDALRDVIADGKNAIIRVSANHFIVVKSIDASGTVTYIEPGYLDSNKGKTGETMTMDSKNLLNVWDGYAITERGPPQDSISRVLTSGESMLIRGSCVDPVSVVLLVIAVVASIVSVVLSFIDKEVCQLLSDIFAIIALVASVVNILYNLPSILSSLGNALRGIGTTVIDKIIIFATSFTQSIEGFVSGITVLLANAVVGISLNMSYNRALTAFGLNSDIAGVTSAFLSGGFSPASAATGYFSISSAIGALVIEGVRYTGSKLGIDPIITNIIGISAATIISAGLEGIWKPVYDVGGTQIASTFVTGLDAISYTIGSTVLPNVASELAYYGITKLGDALGISEISMIAGMGIRSVISAGLRGYNTNDIFQGVMGGLLQGVASIGINYATQELGLNPLLANMGFSVIASAINAGIQAATGGSQDVFKTFFDTYINNALTFLGYGNPGDSNYLWLESSYKASILDFSDIMRQKGLVEALNIYGTSFFNSTTVGAITQSGMTIGRYFYDKLQLVAPTQEEVDIPVTDAGGDVVGSAKFKRNADDSWTLIGREEGSVRVVGKLGKDSYGRLAFIDADIYEDHGTYTMHQVIRDGQQVYAEMIDPQGKTLLIIEPTKDGGCNYYNSHGEYVDAKIADFIKGYDYTFDFNNIFSYNYNVDFVSDTDFSWLISNGLSEDDLSNFRVTETSDNTGADQYSLEWKCGNSEAIPSNWVEALKTPEGKERIVNGFQGFGFVTNSQISQEFERKATLLSSVYDTGAVITVTGRGASANLIKTISGGPYNHTAFLYVDNDGTKWALEMQGPTPSKGLRKVALNDWLATYRAEIDNISIGELSDPNIAADLKNTIERDLFYWDQDSNGNMKVTGEVVPTPYDSANLAGLHWSGYTCSSLIVEIYKHAGHPLFESYGTDWQYQYSPKDVYERLGLLGYVD